MSGDESERAILKVEDDRTEEALRKMMEEIENSQFGLECGSILPSADAGEIDHWNAPGERKAREEDD